MNAPVLSDEALWRLIREDAPHGDLTTGSLDIGACSATIEYAARRPTCVAGVEEAARLLQLCGARAVEVAAASGGRVSEQQPILRAVGDASALHLGWKSAQLLLEWCSGIASRAAWMVAAMRETGSCAALACTRKATPGTRVLAMKAALCGGAIAHRLGLSETLLVTPEHQRFIAADPEVWIPMLAERCPEKRIVVEVLSHEQGLCAAAAGADVIQLEKFTPQAVRRFVAAVRAIAPAVRVAAAGGIDEGNVADYAAAGADVLVSSAPFCAPPADIAVALRPAGPNNVADPAAVLAAC